jgi:hypothetical protein
MIPPDTLAQINNYVHHRGAPGAFLYAVLSNDLNAAFDQADDANRAGFAEIVAYVFNQLPMACRGSAQAVRNWLARPSTS